MQKQFQIIVSGVAPKEFPTETFFGILNCEEDITLEIPKMYPFQGEWGKPTGAYLSIRELFPMPRKIDIVWLSIIEKCFYSIEQNLSVKKFEQLWEEHSSNHNEFPFEYMIIGMAPYGRLAIWFYGTKKSIVVEWLIGETDRVSMKEFLPENPSVSLNDYCKSYLSHSQTGLPPRNLYDKYMQQFSYRYVMLYEYWDEGKEEWQKYDEDETIPEFDYIEEALFDGTHDKLHDGGLMKYHNAGKPKKLAVKWHVKKSDYTAYFWFEDEEIRSIFDRFYGAHPETKMDFMIRIDAENNKYELALYRYGLKEPSVIPESAYQLIVFKNKFESFRSENYAQERGAWIW